MRHDRAHQIAPFCTRSVYGDDRQIDVEGTDLLDAAEAEVDILGQEDLERLQGSLSRGTELDGYTALAGDSGAVVGTAPLESDVDGHVVFGGLAHEFDEADAFTGSEFGGEPDLDAEIGSGSGGGLGEDSLSVGVLTKEQACLAEVGIDEDSGHAIERGKAFPEWSLVRVLVQLGRPSLEGWE